MSRSVTKTYALELCVCRLQNVVLNIACRKARERPCMQHADGGRPPYRDGLDERGHGGVDGGHLQEAHAVLFAFRLKFTISDLMRNKTRRDTSPDSPIDGPGWSSARCRAGKRGNRRRRRRKCWRLICLLVGWLGLHMVSLRSTRVASFVNHPGPKPTTSRPTNLAPWTQTCTHTHQRARYWRPCSA